MLCLLLRRVVALLEQHGLADRELFLPAWQQVWDANLDTCDADGWCMIQLS